MGIRSRFARILSATTNRPDESKRPPDHRRMLQISADEWYRRAFISQFPQVKAGDRKTFSCYLSAVKRWIQQIGNLFKTVSRLGWPVNPVNSPGLESCVPCPMCPVLGVPIFVFLFLYQQHAKHGNKTFKAITVHFSWIECMTVVKAIGKAEPIKKLHRSSIGLHRFIERNRTGHLESSARQSG